VSAEIDRRFEKLVEYLLEHQGEAATAVADQSEPRPWMNFSSDTLETKAEDRKEETLHDVFSRDDANEKYVQARQNEEAKSNEIAVPKLCGDFMASFERDKRAQWRGRIRSVAHAASRQKGNSQEAGPLRRNSLDYVQRVFLKARDREKRVG
jgi:uncharacterized protein (UPF0128 family)